MAGVETNHAEAGRAAAVEGQPNLNFNVAAQSIVGWPGRGPKSPR